MNMSMLANLFVDIDRFFDYRTRIDWSLQGSGLMATELIGGDGEGYACVCSPSLSFFPFLVFLSIWVNTVFFFFFRVLLTSTNLGA